MRKEPLLIPTTDAQFYKGLVSPFGPIVAELESMIGCKVTVAVAPIGQVLRLIRRYYPKAEMTCPLFLGHGKC